MLHFLEPTTIIHAVGVLGITAIIFAESGLFFGFFLPGDSLLFTAGLFAAEGYLNIAVLALLTFIAAVAGDNVGYFFGRKAGPKIFTKEDSFFFHKSHIRKAEAFYQKHGPKTILLARVIPVVRTFAPIVAGIGNMPYRTFFTYNIIGGFVWTMGLTLSGYFLGKAFPNLDQYLTLVIVGIIVVSLLPILFEYLRMRREARRQ